MNNSSASNSLIQSSGLYFQPVLILILTLLLWLGCLKNGLTNWDDEGYIFRNELLKLDFPALKMHFSSFIMGNYHPLTTLSLHFDSIFWKNTVQGYHAGNLILHLLNTFLVWYWLKGSPVLSRFAPAVSLIFGIHPLHVESVAWVSERKDVLYSSFYFMALILQNFRLHKNLSNTIYLPSTLILLILSALSKGMAVTLPLILILNLWLENKITDRKEWAVPALGILISLFFGYLAILAQQSSDSIKIISETQWMLRPVYALFAIGAYLGKIILPIRLSCFYPYPSLSDPALWGIAAITLAGMGALGFFFRKNRIYTWGSVFFLIHLAPVLQILPVGEALYADRYVYIALAGILPALYMLIPESLRNHKLIYVLIWGWILLLGFFTWKRIPVWNNSILLWTQMIDTYPDRFFVAYNNRAIALHEEKKYEAAMKDYNHALKLHPGYREAWYNRGTMKAEMGEKEGAVYDLTQAIRLNPDFYLAWYNRGNSLAALGKFQDAEKDYLEVTRLRPDHAEAWSNLGNIYGMNGIPEKAIAAFNKSISLEADNAQAYNNRALARAQTGDLAGAARDFTEAENLHKKHNNLSAAEETRLNRIKTLGK